jgi:tetrahydromethanopterin S-methyltransferase subunit B
MGAVVAKDQLNVDSDELLRAAIDLDHLADQVEAALAQHQPALAVMAAGRDEVSTAAATTLTTVAETFAEGTAVGVHELRKIAAVLRAQASGYRGAEETIEEAFRL